jgi:hypothetical protein
MSVGNRSTSYAVQVFGGEPEARIFGVGLFACCLHAKTNPSRFQLCVFETRVLDDQQFVPVSKHPNLILIIVTIAPAGARPFLDTSVSPSSYIETTVVRLSSIYRLIGLALIIWWTVDGRSYDARCRDALGEF